MNRFFKLVTTISILIITLNIQAQNFKEASSYLSFIGEEQDDISKNMWKYTKAIAHSRSDRAVASKRKTLIKTVKGAISKISKANGFEGDDYKNKVLRHLNFNLNLLNEDYAKIIDMKAVAEQSYDAMEAYMMAQELADKKLEESQQQYELDFYLFADKNNIKIIENESDLGKKMALSNIVFQHYKEMYLIYFKVYINEVYLMDALNKNDVSGIEQSANALSESANEGLEILKTIKSYKDDASIVKATTAAFNFFKDEAEAKTPMLTEFLVMNEDFEKIKEALEKTPERKRTKKQVDDYNKKVKQLNKGANTFNKINNDLNTKRQQVINKLNVANQNFLSKHIPKD
jgi:hypothetical protein